MERSLEYKKKSKDRIQDIFAMTREVKGTMFKVCGIRKELNQQRAARTNEAVETGSVNISVIIHAVS